MAGSPKKRAIQERDAIKRIEVTAQLQAKEQTLEFPKARVKYTDGLGAEIVGLISNGIPIEDSVLNGAVVSSGALPHAWAYTQARSINGSSYTATLQKALCTGWIHCPPSPISGITGKLANVSNMRALAPPGP